MCGIFLSFCIIAKKIISNFTTYYYIYATRYNIKYGNPAGSFNVIVYVRRLKSLLYNIDSVSDFDREQQLCAIFDKWKTQYIFKIEGVVEEIKKLKEYNEDCVELGCPTQACSEANGVKYK